MKDDSFFFLCTKEKFCDRKIQHMHEKLYWKDFPINPDGTYIISTQNICTSRHGSHMQRVTAFLMNFQSEASTLEKCYEYHLETDTMLGVGGAGFTLRYHFVFSLSWLKQSFSLLFHH